MCNDFRTYIVIYITSVKFQWENWLKTVFLTLQAFSQTSMLGIQGMWPIWFSSDPAEDKFNSESTKFNPIQGEKNQFRENNPNWKNNSIQRKIDSERTNWQIQFRENKFTNLILNIFNPEKENQFREQFQFNSMFFSDPAKHKFFFKEMCCTFSINWDVETQI